MELRGASYTTFLESFGYFFSDWKVLGNPFGENAARRYLLYPARGMLSEQQSLDIAHAADSVGDTEVLMSYLARGARPPKSYPHDVVVPLADLDASYEDWSDGQSAHGLASPSKSWAVFVQASYIYKYAVLAGTEDFGASFDRTPSGAARAVDDGFITNAQWWIRIGETDDVDDKWPRELADSVYGRD